MILISHVPDLVAVRIQLETSVCPLERRVVLSCLGWTSRGAAALTEIWRSQALAARFFTVAFRVPDAVTDMRSGLLTSTTRSGQTGADVCLRARAPARAEKV